jgi:hypothetical protein
MNWRIVWVQGIQPQLSRRGLEALRAGLADNDPAIHSKLNEIVAVGRTRSIIISCDVIAYAFWRGDGVQDPADLRRLWEDVVQGLPIRLGGSSTAQAYNAFFTKFWDACDRQAVFALLLEEVEKSLGLVAVEGGVR